MPLVPSIRRKTESWQAATVLADCETAGPKHFGFLTELSVLWIHSIPLKMSANEICRTQRSSLCLYLVAIFPTAHSTNVRPWFDVRIQICFLRDVKDLNSPGNCVVPVASTCTTNIDWNQWKAMGADRGCIGTSPSMIFTPQAVSTTHTAWTSAWKSLYQRLTQRGFLVCCCAASELQRKF